MFVELFDWICSSLTKIFDVMDKFILFDNFSYFDFAVALMATSIIIKILKFMMAIEDEEPHLEYVSASRSQLAQYDIESWNRYNGKPISFGTYKPKHRSMYRTEYIPRHEYVDKGRHGRK